MDQVKSSRWPSAALFIAATAVCLALAFLCGTAGCVTDAEAARAQARRDVAAVLRVAYEVGGKAAVAEKIDALVAKGKLTPEQGETLKAFADEACEEMLERWEGNGGAASNSTEAVSRDGCGDCSLPGASIDCGGGGCADGSSALQEANGAESDGGRNEDANCGNCEECKAER